MSYQQQPGQFGQQYGPQGQFNQQQGQPGQFGQQQSYQPSQFGQGYGQSGGSSGGSGMVLGIIGLVAAGLHFILWIISFFQQIGMVHDLGSGGDIVGFWLGSLLTVTVDVLLVLFSVRALQKKN